MIKTHHPFASLFDFPLPVLLPVMDEDSLSASGSGAGSFYLGSPLQLTFTVIGQTWIRTGQPLKWMPKRQVEIITQRSHVVQSRGGVFG